MNGKNFVQQKKASFRFRKEVLIYSMGFKFLYVVNFILYPFVSTSSLSYISWNEGLLSRFSKKVSAPPTAFTLVTKTSVQ